MVEPVRMVHSPTTVHVQTTTMGSIVNVSTITSYLTKGLISLIVGIPLNAEPLWKGKLETPSTTTKHLFIGEPLNESQQCNVKYSSV